MPFNFNRKSVFLTYAQSQHLTKEQVKDFLETKSPLKEYVIALEKHSDGNPHIHAFVTFRDQIHTRNERFFDIIDLGVTFHPNIATPNKSDAKARVKQYVAKGGDYISNIQILSAREAAFNEISQKGMSKELVKEYPFLMAMNLQNLLNWSQYMGHYRQLPPIKDMPKKRHIWLFGPSNTGKSYWLRAFIQIHEYPAQLPLNNDYCYFGPQTDLVYADEFKGNVAITHLNSLCDGRNHLNTKGGGTCISYPRVVICSNYHPNDCYPNMSDLELETLKNRFHIIDSSISLPKFKYFGTYEL